MSRTQPGDTSGRRVVIVLILLVLAISASAALYGIHLRSEMPHSEEDHHHETTEETDTGGSVGEVEDHMRSIGYVQ